MKNFIIFFLLICLIASCDKNDEQGKLYVGDGYNFHSKEYENSEVIVEIKTYKSWDELQKKFDELGVKPSSPNEEIIAVSEIDSENPTICTIYMIDPSVQYMPAFIGHEFTHCVYGQFHVSNDSKGY